MLKNRVTPSLLDDVNDVIQIAKLQRLNNLVLTHVALSGDAENQYIILLWLDNEGEYEYMIDFSRGMSSYLLGLNIYRLAPAYKHSLCEVQDKNG